MTTLAYSFEIDKVMMILSPSGKMRGGQIVPSGIWLLFSAKLESVWHQYVIEVLYHCLKADKRETKDNAQPHNELEH
jgi:hypothetical protein